MARLSPSSADRAQDRGLTERCLSPSPMAVAGGPESKYVQIVQGSDYLVIHSEHGGVLRLVPLGPTKPLPSAIRSRSGSSVGRWNNDTLVVETTNFAGDFGFANAAMDGNLHLTERLRRIDPDTLRYQATIDDPTAYATSWSFVLLLRRTDAKVFEFACHEGNYALPNILRAARAAERLAR